MSDTILDADTLRALQAPIKAKYKDDPQAAVITLKASGEIDEAKAKMEPFKRATLADAFAKAEREE